MFPNAICLYFHLTFRINPAQGFLKHNVIHQNHLLKINAMSKIFLTQMHIGEVIIQKCVFGEKVIYRVLKKAHVKNTGYPNQKI